MRAATTTPTTATRTTRQDDKIEAGSFGQGYVVKTLSTQKDTVVNVTAGSAIKPKPTVKVNGTTLKLNRDYTLSYRHNVSRGTATITIKAKDGSASYKGSTTTTFKIVKGANPPKLQRPSSHRS